MMRNMSELAERYVFDHLPVFTQNLFVSMAGQQRFRNRFSEHFHATLEKWQKTIDGPEAALKEIQRERLLKLVERAREHSPFYKDIPAPSYASDAEEAIEETLSRMPVLEKRVYRDNTDAIVTRDIPSRQLRGGTTSGTTGTALRLFYTRETEAEEYATVWRLREALGVGLYDPHFTFTGKIIVPVTQTKPPFWRNNSYSNQLLFSLYHMSPTNLELYVDRLHETDAVYVNGYPSALHLVAREMLATGTTLTRGQLMAVFTSSESLLAFQREDIEEAFGAKVWDRYGSAEFAVSMTGCSEENLHVDMEYCIVEVEEIEETDEWVRGQLLVTGLANNATPFIRYRIGDVGTRLKGPCPCGRPGDVFLDVDGRVEDFIVTPSGRMIGRMDHIFKSMRNVEEAQILQTTPDAIDVVFVPGVGFDLAAETKLRREIRTRLGDEIAVDLHAVTAIDREPNGKFRAVKSTIGKLDS
ncbi:MAG: phenylacetate--CoA ligase family protein [Deltaproteobacteria bacterium]|nr:phenylacetate--CoA ligase family protein [Deltaproteobacteria bacterium]MBW2723398.1 phenylacetate--CoA ligase family protein [Deltaproteobacteria bacterium]